MTRFVTEIDSSDIEFLAGVFIVLSIFGFLVVIGVLVVIFRGQFKYVTKLEWIVRALLFVIFFTIHITLMVTGHYTGIIRYIVSLVTFATIMIVYAIFAVKRKRRKELMENDYYSKYN